VEVAARVLRPFIGSGRRGDGRPGSDGGGGALSGWWPVMEGEVKRRQRQLREGKQGGGGRETSGLVRRRWPEAHGGARCGRATTLDCRKPVVEDEAGGPDQAGLGRAGRVATRPKGLFGLKLREKGKRAAGLFFPIFQTKI
jgi:hypothetical protein